MSSLLFRTALCVACCLAASQSARADIVIADFTADYSWPTPAAGWSYLWNQNGDITDPLNYVALQPDSTAPGSTFPRYDVATNGVFPEGGPASYTVLVQGFMHPGWGGGQGGGFEHYTIAGYTVSAAGHYSLSSVSVTDNDAGGGDGVDVYWAVDNVQKGFQAIDNGGSFIPATSLDLGDLAAGQTIYFAIGSRSDNNFDSTNLQFQVTVPEPSTFALLGLGAVIAGANVWRRRKRRGLTETPRPDTITSA